MVKSDLSNFRPHLSDVLWDIWCIASIVGIWPRFIEPNLIKISRKTITINDLPSCLEGFKILQFSDLHFSLRTSDRFLKKIHQKVSDLAPDLIAFTGDFLCYSQLNEPERLRDFLKQFKAPYGCYAVLGNHDYSETIAVNDNGEYDIAAVTGSMISKGVMRLFKTTHLAKKTTPRAAAIAHHKELIDLLKETPFVLLDNSNRCIPIGQSAFNICGLGEYTLAKMDPGQAFKEFDPRYPGIILLHNPDGLPSLEKYPGEVVLSGHTHGGQVNLPWIWQKFTLLENPQFKSGLIRAHGKSIYINRGIGAVMPFRWFAAPELLLLTLEHV